MRIKLKTRKVKIWYTYDSEISSKRVYQDQLVEHVSNIKRNRVIVYKVDRQMKDSPQYIVCNLQNETGEYTEKGIVFHINNLVPYENKNSD